MPAYEIVFDTSSDRNSLQRKFVKVSAARLASKITELQGRGMIINEVRIAH